MTMGNGFETYYHRRQVNNKNVSKHNYIFFFQNTPKTRISLMPKCHRIRFFSFLSEFDPSPMKFSHHFKIYPKLKRDSLKSTIFLEKNPYSPFSWSPMLTASYLTIPLPPSPAYLFFYLFF